MKLNNFETACMMQIVRGSASLVSRLPRFIRWPLNEAGKPGNEARDQLHRKAET